MTEQELVRIKEAVDQPSLSSAIKEMENVLTELGYIKKR